MKGHLPRQSKYMEKDRILVVDDDPDNRTMIGHFLSNWGYEVDDAKNGKVALEKVAAHPPHLVLLDLEMPEMDGFETCEHLKTNVKTPILEHRQEHGMFARSPCRRDPVIGLRLR